MDWRTMRAPWGVYPMALFGARLHRIPAFMFTQKLMKTVFGKANRSGFYYFKTPGCPRNPPKEAGCDVLGTMMVVSLSVGAVLSMLQILTK